MNLSEIQKDNNHIINLEYAKEKALISTDEKNVEINLDEKVKKT